MTMMDFGGAKRTDRRDMRLMMLAIYPLCLTAALAGRLVRGESESPRRSVFAEASASAHACIPFVFR